MHHDSSFTIDACAAARRSARDRRRASTQRYLGIFSMKRGRGAMSLLRALSTIALVSCSPPMTQSDAGPDVPRLTGRVNPISLSPSIVFEGTRRFVGAIGPALGNDDLSMARPTADAATGVIIEQTECTRLRCVFVARIEDTQPNRGAGISEPSSAMPVTIRISGTEFDYSAQLNVLPADTADGATMGSMVLANQAVYSSMTVPAGVTLRANNLDQPVRFAVLSDVIVQGTFDFSATAMRPGAGGAAGGAPPMGDGQGPTPGIGSMVAGGGGGNGAAGAAGVGPGGVPGGAGGAVSGTRVFAGGSGGGAGGDGAGGHGGGAMILAAFGSLNLDGARFVFAGGAGQGAGGGGAGGSFTLGGVASGRFEVDVRGGAGGSAGGATGGAGGGGRFRVEGTAAMAAVQGAMPQAGPRFDLAMLPPITRSPSYVIRGFAPPGMRVRIQGSRLDATAFTRVVTAETDGTFSTTVSLPDGVTQLMLFDVSDSNAPIASMSGTRVVVSGDAGARTIVGGAVDVAYLPAAE